MNIVLLNTIELGGGVSYRLCEAINKLTDHHALSIALRPTPHKLPSHVKIFEEGFDRVPGLIKNADVLHFNGYPGQIDLFKVKPEECRDKTVLWTCMGGQQQRRKPGKSTIPYREKFPHIRFVVVTPDLTILPPLRDAPWVPSITPIEEYREKFKLTRNDPPKICHTSTVPKRRNVLQQAINELKQEDYQFVYSRWFGLPHERILKEMASYDIFLNFRWWCHFYGVAAQEAATFEMPIVSTTSDHTENYFREHDIQCPFGFVNLKDKPWVEAIKKILIPLIEDKDLREKSGKANYEYVKKMHSAEVVVRKYLEVIE